MVELKPGHFIINGASSWNQNGIKVLIQDRPTIETPERKRDFKSPLGVSGDLVFDENAYEPTKMKLKLLVEGNGDHEVSNNRDLVYSLFDSPGYIPFIPYFDSNKQYRVICTSYPKFVNKWWMNGAQVVEVELKVHPFKYILNVSDFVFTSRGYITNPKLISSLPLIKIEGSGDVKLKINTNVYNIKNVEGHIYVDSELLSSYRLKNSVLTNDNNKIYFREYPFLKPGLSLIDWEGNVSKITISPRWRTLT